MLFLRKYSNIFENLPFKSIQGLDENTMKSARNFVTLEKFKEITYHADV